MYHTLDLSTTPISIGCRVLYKPTVAGYGIEELAELTDRLANGATYTGM